MDNKFTRRQVIERALVAAGWAGLVGSTTLAAACSRETPQEPTNEQTKAIGEFSDADIAWLDEVADTILPETDTPGAKAAGVGSFMALMVTDTYSPEEQAAFREGMNALEAACHDANGAGFMGANAEQRLALLETLDEAQLRQTTQDPEGGTHYFRPIKELTVLGYFTSEIGYTQAMRYVESPGRFDPCVEYTPGEKAWARHA